MNAEHVPLSRHVAQIALVAVSYVVMGRLALLLAIPPGFATAIFPPVGIGLAAVLLWGNPMLVGVLVGSTVLNLSIAWSAGGSFSWIGLLVATGIAVGSCLHNALAAILIRRFIGFPTPLSNEGQVIPFLLFGGPIACLVSATWGTGVLYLAGAVTRAQFSYSWWTWWVGDGTGVLIATPLMFVLFAKPRELWRRRGTTVALPLLIGSAVMVVTFIRASRLEQDRITHRFNDRAHLMATLIKMHFDSCSEVVLLVERFLTAAPQSGRAEFATFAAKVRSAHPELKTTSWAMLVRASEREAFEQRMTGELSSAFVITEKNDADDLVNAQHRAEYMAIAYTEPYAGNAKALGFDLLSEETRAKAINWARDRNDLAITAPIELVQGGTENAILLMHPVYTNAERLESLRGFVSAVLDPRALVDNALATYERGDHDVRLRDITDAENPKVMTGTDTSSSTNAQFLFRDVFPLHGRILEITITPTQAFIQSNRSLQAWVVLAGGLGLCGLLGAFLLIVSGRTRHVEQLVEQRTQELSAVLDNAVEAIITFNRDGHIERTNPATAKLFDYSVAELLTSRITDLLPQLDWNALQSEGITYEVRGYRHDGTPMTLEMTLSQMDIRGRTLFTAMLHDITARKEAERLKNEFISTVSHELRTPLTSISGSLGLISGGVVGDISESVRELVEIAKVNAERLTLLVNDILDIEKLTSGKLDVVLEPHDLRDIVRQSLVQMQGYSDRFGIPVVIDEAHFAAEPVVLEIDASRVLQIMANLLSNAIKFSPTDGQVEVSLEVSDGQACVAVRDHGPGIPANFQQRMFEKFAQADSADTRQRGGTGLGLSISKALVERFGGTIGFELPIDGGTRFYFKLPVVAS